MKRVLAMVLLMPSLGGCVAGMAAGAVGAVARSARGEPVNNGALLPQAVAACSAQGEQYGTVKVIDAQQVKVDRITVWGTTERGGVRQSFECGFGTKVTSFKLRAIAPVR